MCELVALIASGKIWLPPPLIFLFTLTSCLHIGYYLILAYVFLASSNPFWNKVELQKKNWLNWTNADGIKRGFISGTEISHLAKFPNWEFNMPCYPHSCPWGRDCCQIEGLPFAGQGMAALREATLRPGQGHLMGRARLQYSHFELGALSVPWLQECWEDAW